MKRQELTVDASELQKKQNSTQQELSDLISKLESKQENQNQDKDENQEQQSQDNQNAEDSNEDSGDQDSMQSSDQEGDDDSGMGEEKSQEQSAQSKIQDELDELIDDAEQSQQQQGDGSSDGGEGEENEDGIPHVIDNHDIWNTGTQSPDERRMAMQNAISRAMQDCERQYGHHSIPNELRELLNKAVEKPKIKWTQLWKNKIGRKLSSDESYSRKKPNRKYGILAPGKTKKFGPKILIAVDCSGSMSDHEYAEVMAETKGITEDMLERVELIFFDTVVFSESAFVDANLKKIPRRPLSGGTDFQPVIDAANEKKPDFLIILTDGCAPVPKKPKFPVLWGIIGGRDNPDLFGQRVMIELDKSGKQGKAKGLGDKL